MTNLCNNLLVLLRHRQLPSLRPQQNTVFHQFIHRRCLHLQPVTKAHIINSHQLKHIQLMMLGPSLLLLPDVNQERHVPYLRPKLQAHLIVVRTREVRKRLCLHDAVRKHLVHALPRLLYQARLLQHLRQPFASRRTVHSQHIARVHPYRESTGIRNRQFRGTLLDYHIILHNHRPMCNRIQHCLTYRFLVEQFDVKDIRILTDMHLRVQRRLIDIRPDLFHRQKQRLLYLNPCIILNAGRIIPVFYHHIVLWHILPDSLLFPQQYQRRIVQLPVLQQIQVAQRLFVRHRLKAQILVLLSIFLLHHLDGLGVQVIHRQPLAHLGRVVRLLFRQYFQHLAIRHLSQALPRTHQRHTLKLQHLPYRARRHVENDHTLPVQGILRWFKHLAYPHPDLHLLIDRILQRTEVPFLVGRSHHLVRSLVLHTKHQPSSFLVRQCRHIAQDAMPPLLRVFVRPAVIVEVMLCLLEFYMVF